MPVAVGLWAPWCVPSTHLEATLASAAHRFRGRLRVGLLDVEANPRVVERYGLAGLPTLLLFQGTEVVARRVGLIPEDNLVRLLHHHLDGAA